MKVIYSNKTKHDECPQCGSKFVSINGKDVACPCCAVDKITTLERENAELKKRLSEPLVLWVVSESGGQDESDVVVKVCETEQIARKWIDAAYGNRRWLCDVDEYEVLRVGALVAEKGGKG